MAQVATKEDVTRQRKRERSGLPQPLHESEEIAGLTGVVRSLPGLRGTARVRHA